MSPLLDKEEKKMAWNLGQSLDSKKVTSALGYLDLKQICYCLAQAINKHIEFSKANFFLDDLKKEAQTLNQKVGDQVEFSYNLGAQMKIDVVAAKQNAADKEKKKLERNQEFEELKKKMEKNEELDLTHKTPQNLTNQKAAVHVSDDEVEEREDVDYDNDFIEDETPKRDSDN